MPAYAPSSQRVNAAPMAWLRTGCAIAWLACAAPAQAAEPKLDVEELLPVAPWAGALRERLQLVDLRSGGRIGVWVHRIEGGDTMSFRGGERWYLASGVKVPVAIAVLREVAAGRLSFGAPVTLQQADFIEGTGPTKRLAAGSRVKLSFLLEQMIIESDDTAADALIRTIGTPRIDAVVAELMPGTAFTVTSLADVRRRIYAKLDERAYGLRNDQLLALRNQRNDSARLAALAKMLGTSVSQFKLSLDEAYDAYYRSGLNSASLIDYGRLLIALQQGRALPEAHTDYLLALMTRVRTGDRRLKARFPAGVVFAHKTGTQQRRYCDLGIATVAARDPVEHVIVEACVEDSGNLAASENVLREIGAAVGAAGVLGGRTPAFRQP
ncbi:N/A [soil metagenome]